MSLEALFQQIEQQEHIDIPKGWLQGRTIFGGLVAGMLVHKAFTTINDVTQKLLSCSVTFVGSVDDARVKLTAEILRQGKSVTTIEVRLGKQNSAKYFNCKFWSSARVLHSSFARTDKLLIFLKLISSTLFQNIYLFLSV